jgi:hypothetical protein
MKIKFIAATAALFILSSAGANTGNEENGTSLNLHTGLTIFPTGYPEFPGNDTDKTDSLQALSKKYPAVVKMLFKEFRNAENIKYAVKDNLLYLSFKNNGQKVAAVYSMNGHNEYSISNIGTALPRSISDKLKVKYPAYAVFYGRNISVNSETFYQVILESEHEYKVVNLQNEEIEEISRIKKMHSK